MSAANDGGPAYPSVDERHAMKYFGMSLRDHFASNAPITMADAYAACALSPSDDPISIREYRDALMGALARLRYEYADAMLAARESAS